MRTIRLRALSLLLPPLLGSLATGEAEAQDRPLSPRGEAATNFGGTYDGRDYQGGAWIVVDYGRPIKRDRDLFGEGEEYGLGLLSGAPVWRLGANQSTRFGTDADLMFGERRLPAGEYSLFAELAESEWTLIFSSWGAKQDFRDEDPDALWGAYDYTPARDVLRAPMEVSTTATSVDQLTIGFVDMGPTGGSMAVWWDDQYAKVSFSLAP